MGPTDGRARRLVELAGVPAVLCVAVPGAPVGGGVVTASSVAVSAAGPFPLLAAAVRLGLPVAYAGPHGSGPFGDAVRDELTRAGVDVLSEPDDAITAAMIELTEPDGTTSAVLLPGRPTAGGRRPPTAGADDLLHLTGDALHDPAAATEALALLAEQPLTAVLLYDPGERGHLLPVALRARLLARVDWWVGTADAARAATRSDDLSAAALLAGLTRRGVLVTDATSTVLAERGASPRRLPAAASHTDAVAGFAAGVAKGRSPAAAASSRE